VQEKGLKGPKVCTYYTGISPKYLVLQWVQHYSLDIKSENHSPYKGRVVLPDELFATYHTDKKTDW